MWSVVLEVVVFSLQAAGAASTSRPTFNMIRMLVLRGEDGEVVLAGAVFAHFSEHVGHIQVGWKPARKLSLHDGAVRV